MQDGRVTGLCFQKCEYSLLDLEYGDVTAKNFDFVHVMSSLRKAVIHLHSLGLAHNDINPQNVMIDSQNVAVLIDFDSAAPEGCALLKHGTPEWIDEPISVSSKENDLNALEKMNDYLKKLSVKD